jgi:hypothetical protein
MPRNNIENPLEDNFVSQFVLALGIPRAVIPPNLTLTRFTVAKRHSESEIASTSPWVNDLRVMAPAKKRLSERLQKTKKTLDFESLPMRRFAVLFV